MNCGYLRQLLVNRKNSYDTPSPLPVRCTQTGGGRELEGGGNHPHLIPLPVCNRQAFKGEEFYKTLRRTLMIEMTIEEVIKLLEQEYGSLEWKPGTEPIGVLIGTILSQNTSDVNSRRAFDSLIDTFGSWERVVVAPVEHIAQVIKFAGLSRIKAVRIKQILAKIEKEQGGISLDFLKSMDMTEAKDYLLHLPGVGQKTASCVLLFGVGKPCLPVDTHVFRVAKRLGLIGSKVSVEEAHSLLQEQIPPSKVYQFHLYMIEHGRQVCHARQPRCNDCGLKEICPSLPVRRTQTGSLASSKS